MGQHVEVRAMPHDLRRIEVFVGGRWLATAYPQATLSAEQREAGPASRQADAAELPAAAQADGARALAPSSGRVQRSETTVIAANTGRVELQHGR